MNASYKLIGSWRIQSVASDWHHSNQACLVCETTRSWMHYCAPSWQAGCGLCYFHWPKFNMRVKLLGFLTNADVARFEKQEDRRSPSLGVSSRKRYEFFFSFRGRLRFACCAAAVEPKATVMLNALTKTALRTWPHFSSFLKSFTRRPSSSCHRRCQPPSYWSRKCHGSPSGARCSAQHTYIWHLATNHSVSFLISRETFCRTDNSRNFSRDTIFRIHNDLYEVSVLLLTGADNVKFGALTSCGRGWRAILQVLLHTEARYWCGVWFLRGWGGRCFQHPNPITSQIEVIWMQSTGPRLHCVCVSVCVFMGVWCLISNKAVMDFLE